MEGNGGDGKERFHSLGRIALITDPPSLSLSLHLSRFEQDLNGRLSRHSISRLYLWIIGGKRERERERATEKKEKRG